MSHYQKFIHEIAPDGPNPAGVEASMRLMYGTLSHLPKSVFKKEVEIAAACERQEPGYLLTAAESYGMAEDFQQWEQSK